MALEAPYSKYKKQNYLIAIIVCIVLASWCAYDGYFNQKWIDAMLRNVFMEQNPERESNYLSSLLLNGNYFHSTMLHFAMEFFESIDNELFGIKAIQLSSLGRCLQGFYRFNNEPTKLSKYSDPFAFYLFGTVQYHCDDID